MTALLRKRRFTVLLLAALVAMATPAPLQAVQPDEILADRELEARARALSAGLRCLVCQNQSIDDSNAPLARDLRLVVRERLKAGDSDAAVIDFVVGRYGEYVLLKPRIGIHTVILWLTPLLLLTALGALVWSKVRVPAAAAPAPLSAEEKARLDSLLKEQGEGPVSRT